MKKFDYFKWEKEKNIEWLRNTSGAKTFECGLELAESGFEFLKYSILSEKPKLSWSKIKQEMIKILWHKK